MKRLFCLPGWFGKFGFVADISMTVIHLVVTVTLLLSGIKHACADQQALHAADGLFSEASVSRDWAADGEIVGVAVRVAVVSVLPGLLQVAVIQVCTNYVNIRIITKMQKIKCCKKSFILEKVGGGIHRNDHKKRSIRKIWKLLKFKRICSKVLPEGTTVYLPNEIQLSNWSPDTQSFSNVSNNLLGVAICNLTWFTDQSPVLQITSSDFLKKKKR